MKVLPAIPAATVMKKAEDVSIFTKYRILFLVIATFTATSGLVLTLLSIGLGVEYGNLKYFTSLKVELSAKINI